MFEPIGWFALGCLTNMVINLIRSDMNHLVFWGFVFIGTIIFIKKGA
jgi:hypothetical protein